MNRSKLARQALLIAVAAALCPASAWAQTSVATGAIKIERALAINIVRRPVRQNPTGSVDGFATGEVIEAVVEITGDPGRVYRVRLAGQTESRMRGAADHPLMVRSETSGDITDTMTARINAAGYDRLTIGGRQIPGLVIDGANTAIPLSIDYE